MLIDWTLRPPGQLGDEIGHPGDVGGERLGLEVKYELALGQERPTTSRGPIIPLRGAARTGTLWDRSAGLHTLHHRQQLLLLTLQQRILLPQLVAKLGLVRWLYVGQSVLLGPLDGTRRRPGIFKVVNVFRRVVQKAREIRYT